MGRLLYVLSSCFCCFSALISVANLLRARVNSVPFLFLTSVPTIFLSILDQQTGGTKSVTKRTSAILIMSS